MTSQIPVVLKELQQNFDKHITKSVDWRIDQLKALKQGILDM